jgi:dTDP-4-dehydrorhamnose reductase
MKILLTGKTGQIGEELNNIIGDLGNLIAVDKEQLDLSKPNSIEPVILDIKPDIIINSAAYTAVDKAEEEPDLAMTVNAVAPGLLAKAARKVGAGLIHYSTDYVFDGCSEISYKEEDLPNPLNVYGKTKLAGEQAIAEVGIPFLIIRTSWVYSLHGKNFLRTIKKLAEEKDTIQVIEDQIGAPTWARSIALKTHQIIKQCLNKKWLETKESNLSGIFHVTSQGKTSWHGFAREVLNMYNTSQNIKLIAIPTSDYPTPAVRPANSLLNNEKIHKVFGIDMPQWEDALKDCMDSN